MNEEDRLPASVSKAVKQEKQLNYLMGELSDMQHLPGKGIRLCDGFFEQFLEIYKDSGQYFKKSVFHPATAPSKNVEISSGVSLRALSTNPSGIGGTSTGS